MSVLGGLPNDGEVICVDDGSTNGTMPVFYDKRVRVLHLNRNIGQAAARNEALAVACGEWISFVDSDDEVIASIYDECLKPDVSENADVIVFGVTTLWKDEGLCKDDVPEMRYPSKLDVSGIENQFGNCLFEYVWNRVVRKSFLDANNIRFDSGICPGEDTIFNLKCVLAGARFAQVPKVGYKYYRTFSTSLARYQWRYDESVRMKNDFWRKARAALGVEDDETIRLGELSDGQMAYWMMKNQWRYDSPITMHERWRWLAENRKYFDAPIIFVYLQQLMEGFARRYFYFEPIRRWKIRRLFNNVKEIK